MPGEEPIIAYTAKELLAKLSDDLVAGFARVETKLDGKADKSDVEALRTEVRHVGERTDRLEEWRHQQQALDRAQETSWSRHQVWLSIAAVLVASGVGALITVLAH